MHGADCFPRRQVGRVSFVASDPRTITEWLIAAAVARRGDFTVRLANAYSVSLCRNDPRYADLLNSEGLTLPDGFPVALLMRAGQPQGERVRGPSLFREVLDGGQSKNLKHYVVGTNDRTLDLLKTAIQTRFPRARVVGLYAPPFGDLNGMPFDEIATEIHAASPHIVWVAMGTPKQDFVAREIQKRTGVTCVGIGAAVDFVAGTAREAPMWMQHAGLEWLFRLATEPRRLWRRYLFGNAVFVIEVFSSALRRLSTVGRQGV